MRYTTKARCSHGAPWYLACPACKEIALAIKRAREVAAEQRGKPGWGYEPWMGPHFGPFTGKTIKLLTSIR